MKSCYIGWLKKTLKIILKIFEKVQHLIPKFVCNAQVCRQSPSMPAIPKFSCNPKFACNPQVCLQCPSSPSIPKFACNPQVYPQSPSLPATPKFHCNPKVRLQSPLVIWTSHPSLPSQLKNYQIPIHSFPTPHPVKILTVLLRGYHTTLFRINVEKMRILCKISTASKGYLPHILA